MSLSKWRPINEAPQVEFVKVVLLSRDHGQRGVMPGVFDGEKWRALTIAGLMEFVNPTHFMELPDPPS